MSKIIELLPKDDQESAISKKLNAILESRKKGKRPLLTPENLRKRQGLECVSDEEAKQIIQTIKDLASLFFEIACFKKA